MEKLLVKTGCPYEVCVGHGLLRQSGELIRQVCPKARIAAVVTDTTVQGLYAPALMASLENAGFSPVLFAFTPGEEHKTLRTLGEIYEFLAQNGVTRTDCLVALGGGIPGDVGGFAAASYLRGIDVVQIPTTFLAQIDSSVGGKTAVNIPQGKNLVGAFWQPRRVLCDIDTLSTLPEDIFADGAAEALKYGMIASRELYKKITEDMKGNLETVIRSCIAIKRDIVQRDERDTGERMLLNFGHTLGHAVEKHSRHQISHGRAVAIGMNLMTALTTRMGLTQPGVSEELKQACQGLGLPTDYPCTLEELLQYASSDKKRAGDSIRIVAAEKIGTASVWTLPFEKLCELMLTFS